MKKFVVVCGPGRSGTSLATSLVEACEFNFGEVNDFQHESFGGLRHGYGENNLTNSQGEDIETAIDKLELEGANACKLIHLYAQWIPRLIKRGYDLHIVVTSRDIDEIWNSGMDIYPGWRDNAIQAICGTADRITRETQRYLGSNKYKAYHLPFEKVIAKDSSTLLGLAFFLRPIYYDDSGEELYDGSHGSIWLKMSEIIKPEIVQHAKKTKE